MVQQAGSSHGKRRYQWRWIGRCVCGWCKGPGSNDFSEEKRNSYAAYSDAAITADAAFEDITAAIFDADGDGDKDMVVGSGGYELQPNDALLQNRLYLNNGRGKFSKSAGLPKDVINDNAIAVADFNGDGALDIYNGGFCVPGKYPEASGSQLLINDGKGNFKNDAAWINAFQ